MLVEKHTTVIYLCRVIMEAEVGHNIYYAPTKSGAGILGKDAPTKQEVRIVENG